MMLDADKMVATADSQNPTLAGALTRLQRCAFSGSWEVRIGAIQALITLAIRLKETYWLQIYGFLHVLAQGGLQSQVSGMKINNGEDQGASGTGLGSLISLLLRVLDDMYRGQDELMKELNAKRYEIMTIRSKNKPMKNSRNSTRHEELLDLVSLFHFVSRVKYLPLGSTSIKLIEIYRNRHNISASSGLNDPAVATGMCDLVYESKATALEPSSMDPDLAMAWAANLGDGMWENNAPAMDRDTRSAATGNRFSNNSFGGSKYLRSASPICEEPPSHSSSVMKGNDSFENPLAGRSFGSHNDDDKVFDNPQFGKALYDFTASGDDDRLIYVKKYSAWFLKMR